VTDVATLLQELIRFDTTNPPGNEEACVAHIEALLHANGIETERYEKAPRRPNLIARHRGTKDCPPLMLYGHVDVVTTVGQNWTHPAFGGESHDGDIWGRGALDMKGGVAMCVRAFLDAVARNVDTPLILLILSDEENGGDYGAAFMADAHADALGGAKHALGEFGGAAQTIGGRRFYPIQVAEKQISWLKATVRGPGGHGAMGVRGSAMTRLGDVLSTLERKQPPVHVIPLVREWFETMAAHLPRTQAIVMRRMLDPRTADLAVRAIGPRGRIFGRVIRNTVSPTIVRGGDKINVIPSEVELELDGRILPGQTPDDLIRELYHIVGRENVEFEVVRHDAGPPEPDLSQYGLLADVLRELDPDGIPVPMLQAGVTDARHLSRAGVQSYGYLPLRLPDDFEITPLIHNADERVPADALQFGVDAIARVIDSYPA
jgi:acetylornithine deacetylase/succinyl-diaminopimelate desuccinylase-like protein